MLREKARMFARSQGGVTVPRERRQFLRSSFMVEEFKNFAFIRRRIGDSLGLRGHYRAEQRAKNEDCSQVLHEVRADNSEGLLALRKISFVGM
jgi:hypothetical protein